MQYANLETLDDRLKSLPHDADSMYYLNIRDLLDEVPASAIPLPGGVLQGAMTLARMTLNDNPLLNPKQRMELSAKIGQLIGE